MEHFCIISCCRVSYVTIELDHELLSFVGRKVINDEADRESCCLDFLTFDVSCLEDNLLLDNRMTVVCLAH